MTNKGTRKSSAFYLAVLLSVASHFAHPAEGFRLEKTEGRDEPKEADEDFQRGRIVFGDVFEKRSGADAQASDGAPVSPASTEVDANYQADRPGLQVDLPAHMQQALDPSVLCGHSQMKLMVQGPDHHDLAMEHGAGAQPVPLSQVPAACGYNVQHNPNSLVMMAPYSSCFMIQEGAYYVLPMSWHGNHFSLWCPMNLPNPSTPQLPPFQPPVPPFPWILPSMAPSVQPPYGPFFPPVKGFPGATDGPVFPPGMTPPVAPHGPYGPFFPPGMTPPVAPHGPYGPFFPPYHHGHHHHGHYYGHGGHHGHHHGHHHHWPFGLPWVLPPGVTPPTLGPPTLGPPTLGPPTMGSPTQVPPILPQQIMSFPNFPPWNPFPQPVTPPPPTMVLKPGTQHVYPMPAQFHGQSFPWGFPMLPPIAGPSVKPPTNQPPGQFPLFGSPHYKFPPVPLPPGKVPPYFPPYGLFPLKMRYPPA